MSDPAGVEKVFWADPYLTALDATVVRVDGTTVTLDRTVFFAESGGQESDAGTIAGRPVLEARKQGKDIAYTLDGGHGLAPGDTVRVEIDWNRRYRLMRLHFAAEIVLELVYAAFPGIEKTGAHISADKARIDFALDESIAPTLSVLQTKADAIIAADREITSAFSDGAAERRYWKIPDFAAVPCGGTHLKRTGEIGVITLKRKNPGKGKERIEVALASEPHERAPVQV